MPFDAVCLTAVLKEIAPAVAGARVDKIYQPAREEVLLSLRGAEGSVRLLLTANRAHPRLQLTAAARENPAAPPMFCMLLRKHLSGARILSVSQPPMERVADIAMEARDELGVRTPRHLILEAIGRRSNLILTGADGRIIDCLYRVDAEMSPTRQVLPGLFYHLPPAQENKANPLDISETDFAAILAETPEERKISDFLLDHFSGLSPLLCRELAFSLTGDTDGRLCETKPEAITKAFFSRTDDISAGRFTPVMLLREDRPVDFTWCPVTQYGSGTVLRQYKTFSAMLDQFYAQRERDERIRSRGAELIRSVTTLRARTARKLENQRRELMQAEDRSALRIRGDLITANLYAMHRGMRELKCENCFDPAGGQITIELDPRLTPQQNAAAFYRRYKKAKTAERMLTEQIAIGQADLDYLDSVLTCIQCASEDRDLSEIRRELESGGYLKPKKNTKKQMKQPASRPLEFQTPAGMSVLVGRNNLQNDRLTLKTADRSDVWFHVKDIHGAHVILRTAGAQPDAESLLCAAQLAARYSQARDEKNVAVDYTLVRYVKKPSGARPGKVIYTHYTTLYVTPESNEAVDQPKIFS